MTRCLKLSLTTNAAVLISSTIGHMPLLPYIDRPDEDADRASCTRPCTAKPGAAEEPTAGLHFDDPPLAKLRDKGIEMASATAQVGAGYFQPVRV